MNFKKKLLALVLAIFTVIITLYPTTIYVNGLGKRNNKQQIPWGIKRVEADSAWKKTTGKGVKVAVVDSGIAKHEDLIKNIRGEFNAIETDKPATDDFGK